MTAHCIYITRHPIAGKFYIGKGKTKDVVSGRYKGSGCLLQKYFAKYPKMEWVTSVLQTFETSKQAFDAEALIVTKDVVASENCLNLKTGGTLYCEHSAETKRKMSASQKLVIRAKRGPLSAEARAIRRKWNHSDEAKAKMSTSQKLVVHAKRGPMSAETRAKISAARRKPKVS